MKRVLALTTFALTLGACFAAEVDTQEKPADATQLVPVKYDVTAQDPVHVPTEAEIAAVVAPIAESFERQRILPDHKTFIRVQTDDASSVELNAADEDGDPVEVEVEAATEATVTTDVVPVTEEQTANAPDFTIFNWRSNRWVKALVAAALGFNPHVYVNKYKKKVIIGAFPDDTDGWLRTWARADESAQASVSELLATFNAYNKASAQDFDAAENKEESEGREYDEELGRALFSLPNPLLAYISRKIGFGMAQFQYFNTSEQVDPQHGYSFKYFAHHLAGYWFKLKPGKQEALADVIFALAEFCNTHFEDGLPFSMGTFGKRGLLRMQLRKNWCALS